MTKTDLQMPRILFVCPDLNEPAGGIKQIYRQVEVLNNNGYDAYVLHGRQPFKISWFKHNAPVLWDSRVMEIDKSTNVGVKRQLKIVAKKILQPNANTLYTKKTTLKLNEHDIIVLPEFYGKALDTAFQNQQTVIYNQNCYYSFRGYDYKQLNTNSIYQQKRLNAVIVASEDAADYISLIIENTPLLRVKYGIDDKVFSFSESKKKQIAFMPRKLKEDSVQIFNILHQRNLLNEWTIKPIDGLDEQEVAEVLKESAIFLSFNHREGFGMPPAEAMACGCIVVGYAGQGGNEIFDSSFSYPVKDRDIVGYVKTLETVLKSYDQEPEVLKSMAKQASQFILSNYSMIKEEQSILSAWKKIELLKN